MSNIFVNLHKNSFSCTNALIINAANPKTATPLKIIAAVATPFIFIGETALCIAATPIRLLQWTYLAMTDNSTKDPKNFYFIRGEDSTGTVYIKVDKETLSKKQFEALFKKNSDNQTYSLHAGNQIEKTSRGDDVAILTGSGIEIFEKKPEENLIFLGWAELEEPSSPEKPTSDSLFGDDFADLSKIPIKESTGIADLGTSWKPRTFVYEVYALPKDKGTPPPPPAIPDNQNVLLPVKARAKEELSQHDLGNQKIRTGKLPAFAQFYFLTPFPLLFG